MCTREKIVFASRVLRDCYELFSYDRAAEAVADHHRRIHNQGFGARFSVRRTESTWRSV
ncbi:hypothetical protein J6590_078038 [Homalodisca vitripennis]|nr:hypothetical protein J6590_078038 [Homalodisca vitripennis]